MNAAVGNVLSNISTNPESFPAVDEFGPSFDEFGPAVDELTPAVDELTPAVDELGPTEVDWLPSTDRSKSLADIAVERSDPVIYYIFVNIQI